MEQIKEVFEIIADWIEIIGLCILIYGFVKIFIKFIKKEFFQHPFKTAISTLQEIRCDLGIYILLSLDFLIAADIIFSISDLSQEQLVRLSVMIVVRIAIGYFLGKEIEELSNEKD
ncbi:MAG: putative membrane protein [Crocinitomicaceae bacterium]|jgi:uncharacterized membrane protein